MTPSLFGGRFATVRARTVSTGPGRLSVGDKVAVAARWCLQRVRTEAKESRLRVRESVTLGDRRFVSVLEVDARRFLVGSTPTQIVLLAELGSAEPETCGQVCSAGFDEALSAAYSQQGEADKISEAAVRA